MPITVLPPGEDNRVLVYVLSLSGKDLFLKDPPDKRIQWLLSLYLVGAACAQ